MSQLAWHQWNLEARGLAPRNSRYLTVCIKFHEKVSSDMTKKKSLQEHFILCGAHYIT
jgi:hypothetical protein